MALHLTSCVPHGLVDTSFGKEHPRLAEVLDRVNADVAAFNEGRPVSVNATRTIVLTMLGVAA